MVTRLPPLTSVRTFVTAARAGSFLKAADELCVTPAAVSRSVRALEDHLAACQDCRDRLAELFTVVAMLDERGGAEPRRSFRLSEPHSETARPPRVPDPAVGDERGRDPDPSA